MATTRAEAPLLTEGQALSYLTVNEALALLDAFTQLKLLSLSENDPPGSPSMGDAYVVGTGTGAWAGSDGKIALWISGWRFIELKEGMFAWDAGGSVPIVWNGTSWDELEVVP